MTERVAGEDLTDAAAQLPMPPSRPAGEGSVRVVGTAHVSHESVAEVERVIEGDRPDVVAVELDEGRYRQMQGEAPEDLEPSDLLGGNTVFQFLAYWMLSYVQTRLGDRFDIDPGADMMAAVETAEGLGLGVALVDRDIQTTIQRFWTRLSVPAKLKLVANLTLAVGPPSLVGLGVGATFGLFTGFAAVTLLAGSLGVAGADFVAALGPATVGTVGGLVGGTVAGLALWAVFDPTLRQALGALGVPTTTPARIAAGAVLGAAVGVALARTGGLALGPLSLSADRFVSLGGFALQAGTGMAAGAFALGSVGALAGLVVERSLPEHEDIDEIDIDELTDADVVTAMMEEFRRFSPGGAEALIDERDAYIAHRLVALREAGYRVVAVVGAGHRAGIEAYLEDPESLPPMESLVGEAESGGLSRVLYKAVGYAITVGFLAFFVLLALGGAQKTWLLELFAAWFIVNGVLAGGMARLAGARWPSALAGGGVAWLTSVNPLLAPGWFAGYVELRYRAVSVADIDTLNTILDDGSAPVGEIIARMREVPLFRLILVVALTNVGSMIASLIVFPAILPWLSTDIGGVSAIGGHLVEGARTGADILLEAVR
ncbi:conjugal transfer protein TraB [Halobacteriales archaeon QS_4_69_31]|nr:MAG: conjugal transfer protein TraB [Halobacteriales archaeon QS_4_69_31]